MWICTRCQKLNSSKKEYCVKCGERNSKINQTELKEKKQVIESSVDKIVFYDLQKNQKFKGSDIVFGREDNNSSVNFSLKDYNDAQFVSKVHARIFVKDGKRYLTDLNSSNGTFVNGERVFNTVSVKSGDEVSFANRIKFKISE